VAEEIAKLEAELDSRHDQEIAEFKNSSGDSKEVHFHPIYEVMSLLKA